MIYLVAMLHAPSSVFDSVDSLRIMNAVQASGVVRKRLFNAAYKSKKQAIVRGMCSDI